MTDPVRLALELEDPSRRHRALTARRLGWLGDRRVVPALLAAAGEATDEICSLLDALGRIGDPAAVPLAREYAERELLSRRRSGVEALRNLGDEEGLAAIRERAAARLEPEVSEALSAIDENDSGAESVGRLRDAVQSLAAKRRGRAADTLYEIGTPAPAAAAREVLATLPADRAFVWRYLKSVLKRAMLRGDAVTLGWAAHWIERAAARTTGTEASIKSGRDGEKRSTGIFQRRTQRWVLRSVWRHLSSLARHQPERYTEHAAEVLARYEHEDAVKPKGLYGAFAHCYLLHRILWGQSPRYELNDHNLRWRRLGAKPPAAAPREESYPELWDRHPRAYLRLLSAARLVEVQEFAVTAVRERHPELVLEATLEELHGMLQAQYPPATEMALAELQRRFDPENPDWTLVLFVAEDDRDEVRAVAHDWLRRTAPLWTRHAGPTLSWLDARHADIRLLAGDLVAAGLADAPEELRRELAARLLERLRQPETEEGRHEAYASVAVVLAAELGALLSTDEVLHLIDEGSDGAKTTAGAVLGRRPEALEELGDPRVLALAEHELRGVRAAAQSLFAAAQARFRDDPSLLFLLVESDWDDNRAFALELIAGVDLERLGLEGLLALCDSNRVDVQEMGKERIRRSFEELDRELVTRRLAEHPHRNVRRFVVELVTEHLEEGAEALERLDGFFRAVLFDLRPERRLKRAVVDFLVERGRRDAVQAAVAARILDDAVRTSFQGDFEHALAALVRLRLTHPATPSLVELEAAP